MTVGLTCRYNSIQFNSIRFTFWIWKWMRKRIRTKFYRILSSIQVRGTFVYRKGFATLVVLFGAGLVSMIVSMRRSIISPVWSQEWWSIRLGWFLGLVRSVALTWFIHSQSCLVGMNAKTLPRLTHLFFVWTRNYFSTSMYGSSTINNR